MKTIITHFFWITWLSIALSSSVLAETSQYKQEKRPDGSIVSEYESAGAKVKQIQRPDGTIETDAFDAKGNETITTQHPNGKIEVKTKTK